VAAVRQLHSLGLVHGDLKLTNICVNSTPVLELKLIDFGLSARFGDSGTIGGNPEYMLPNHSKNKTNLLARDGWGLGVCLYKIMLGTMRGQLSVCRTKKQVGSFLGGMSAMLARQEHAAYITDLMSAAYEAEPKTVEPGPFVEFQGPYVAIPALRMLFLNGRVYTPRGFVITEWDDSGELPSGVGVWEQTRWQISIQRAGATHVIKYASAASNLYQVKYKNAM
jgi:hypothetical protein